MVCNEAPELFRQKEQYSIKEQLQFLQEFYSLYMRLSAIFDEADDLKDGGHIILSSNEHIDKTKLTRALLDQEYDICVSVIFFNLSKEEIIALVSYAKSVFLMQQALIVEKIFEKYND
ncbi:MAG: hypothetical protein RL154_1468 [Pseudomonadota bacterium]